MSEDAGRLEVVGFGRCWYIVRVKVTAGGKRMAKRVKLFDTRTTKQAAENQLKEFLESEE